LQVSQDRMKAIRYYGIKDVRTEDVEIPNLSDDEVLIKVLFAGICGSDLHIYNKQMFIENIPETMGHEYIGRIEKIGVKVFSFTVGDYVLSNPMIPCCECSSCKAGQYNTCEQLSFIGESKPGCFAEYIAVKEETLVKVPKTDDVRQFALVEPLAVALNICNRAMLESNDSIAIIGAGPIGLLTINVAKKIYGVKSITVVDLSDDRLKIAKKMGASKVTKKLESGKKYKKIIECAGVEATLKSAFDSLSADGYLYVVSIFEQIIQFDINQIVGKQLNIVGCNVYESKDLEDAVTYIAIGKINASELISREFSLDEGQKAFELLNSSDKKVAKILFKI